MRTYLVTGAAGFIGAAVARQLIEEGHEVVVVDNLSTGYADMVPAEATFIQKDCQDQSLIEELEKFKFEAIFHIAGQSSGEISFDNPVYDLQTNTQSTLMLLDYARKNGCEKLIYASTMSVYGDQPDFSINESYSPKPKSFYGVGKLASEHYLRIFSETYGLKTSALRLFNVYGPGQNLNNMRQGMASIFISQALTDNKIHVMGDKKRFRDFIYVDDVAKAFLAVEKASLPEYECFNICNNHRITVEQVVDEININLDSPVPVTYSGSTPGDQFGIVGDNTKTLRYLDWTPEVGFSSGMNKMIQWAKMQLKNG